MHQGCDEGCVQEKDTVRKPEVTDHRRYSSQTPVTGSLSHPVLSLQIVYTQLNISLHHSSSLPLSFLPSLQVSSTHGILQYFSIAHKKVYFVIWTLTFSSEVRLMLTQMINTLCEHFLALIFLFLTCSLSLSSLSPLSLLSRRYITKTIFFEGKKVFF